MNADLQLDLPSMLDRALGITNRPQLQTFRTGDHQVVTVDGSEVRKEIRSLGLWTAVAEEPTIPSGWRRLQDHERIIFGDCLWDGGSYFQPIIGRKLIDFSYPSRTAVVIRPSEIHRAHIVVSWRRSRMNYREWVTKQKDADLIKHRQRAEGNEASDIMAILREELARRGIQ